MFRKNKIEINAIQDSDLADALKQISQFNDLIEGEIKCISCKTLITESNIRVYASPKSELFKSIIFILITCIAILACGQTVNESKEIVNTKTEKHIKIPGTKLFIIPPKGFEISNSFLGLEKGGNSIIQVLEKVDGDFYADTEEFTKESFEQLGIKVFEFKEFKINEFPAKYIVMQGEQNIRSINVVFGDSTFSTMIIALYPSSDDKTFDEIQSVINSIYYDKNLKFDPFESASFTLDDSQSAFKFSKATSGFYIYSIDGKDVDPTKEEAFVTVSTIPKDSTVSVQDIFEMMLESLYKYGLTNEELKNVGISNINGHYTYEGEIYGEINGENNVIYQLVIDGHDRAIFIQGRIKSDFTNHLNEIKKLAHTIQLK